MAVMNVIVIVTDSLRADHVGCYGSHVQTPNLDRLAAEGTVFEHAYSENLPTMPTRRAWWTGRYHFHRAGWQPFENSDYLLAEVLWDKGYTSALITDTYHMHKPVYNCGRGFDTVVWVRGQEYDPWIIDPDLKVDVTTYHRLRHGTGNESDELWLPRFTQYMKNISVRKCEEDYFVARVVKEAIRWLEHVTKTQKDRLFLWVDCFDPHEPWDPPEPYRSMYDPGYKGQELIDPVPGPVEGYMTPEEVQHTKALYAGEVTFVDKWIGILLERIRDLGLYDNSLIMHVSDHGEPFGEHGIIRKARPWDYEELVHVPWILRHPDGIGAGRRIAALVQTVDLMPTVLDALDIPAPLELSYLAPNQRARTIFPQDLPAASQRVHLSGKSLMPLLCGDVEKVRDYVFGGHWNREWAVRTHEWSYLLPIDGSRPPELYDRTRDPAEQRNVIDQHPDVAAELELHLRRFVDTVDTIR
jgi:arylsulfatase A-like enzyme